jgi:hypothetical protein
MKMNDASSDAMIIDGRMWYGSQNHVSRKCGQVIFHVSRKCEDVIFRFQKNVSTWNLDVKVLVPENLGTWYFNVHKHFCSHDDAVLFPECLECAHHSVGYKFQNIWNMRFLSL